MIVIDSFLDKSDLEDLKQIVLGSEFPSYMNDGVTHTGDGHIQFTHLINRDDKFTSSFTLGGLDIFKQKLNFSKIVRAKFNLLQRTDTIIEHGFHTDIQNPSEEIKTAIFYLNTNNGYTKFKNGDIFESKENTLIMFDSQLEHCGTTCTDRKYRAVFNLNFFKEKNETD